MFAIRIDYNGEGALRDQRHIPTKKKTNSLLPPPPPPPPANQGW